MTQVLEKILTYSYHLHFKINRRVKIWPKSPPKNSHAMIVLKIRIEILHSGNHRSPETPSQKLLCGLTISNSRQHSKALLTKTAA